MVSVKLKEGSTHPFAALPGVCQHLLQGTNRQRLLQHKVADAQVRRDILQGGSRRKGVRHKEGAGMREDIHTLKKTLEKIVQMFSNFKHPQKLRSRQ